MSRAPGRDAGPERHRVAYDTRREAGHVNVNVKANLVPLPDVEDGQGPGDGQPDGEVGQLPPGTDAAAVAEDVGARVRGRVGA